MAVRASEWCAAHHPDYQGQRRAGASKGGKAKPSRELASIKRELRGVLGGVLKGQIQRGVGAVLFQGYNTLLKAVEVERKIKETEELEERLEALEQAQEQRGGRWGA